MGISIGMVGLGAFGAGFVDLFKAHPQVDRIALCDKEPERVRRWAEDPFMAEKFNARDAYDSLDAICRSDIDALVVITQPWLHAPQCIQAMQHGKHVYSAVPVSCVPDGNEILDWCDKIIETTRATGRHYMLGETSYYLAESMFMRRKQAEGAFGRIVSAESEYSHDYAVGTLWHVKHMRCQTSRTGREWPQILKEKYTDKGIVGGPMHYPTHSVSGPVSIMRAHALKVSAIGTRPTGYDRYFENVGCTDESAFSNETAFFHMSNGAVLTAREHREISGEGYEMRVFGTCGTWRGRKWYWTKREHGFVDGLDPDERPLRKPPHGVEEPTPEQMRDPLPREVQKAFMRAEHRELTEKEIENMDYSASGHGGSHPYLVHEFVSAVAENRVPAINAWEAARYMAMGAMAHQSALKDGELLPVPDWGDAP